ncbi:MAG TPA: bifunctional phosphoserine phosphatase/homoserine phosphotransferase ThrH [Treponema sp.]|nr:bifunctional phosphoserine phosphatase/homoserine phosphotransferase ThrH [Treponema sp.]
MNVLCLDLEGVLVPEIWIEFSRKTGIPELSRTTRDEPDYSKLMNFRIEILKKNKLFLPDIQEVIGSMDPMPGASAFIDTVRSETQVIILSDTFTQFAQPLMKKLGYPTLFCNTLEVAQDGTIIGFSLRQDEGKKQAVTALQGLNLRVMAAGDSYNDLGMIQKADTGAFFRSPKSISSEYPQFPAYEDYDDLLAHMRKELIGS